MATMSPPDAHQEVERVAPPCGSTGGVPAHVTLVEDQVFLAKEVHADDVWFLDTGASNHMTGAKGVFAKLDTGVTGTVKFGDGSVVDIQGRGMILFACRNGEHHALTDVYYIPRLRRNIVSLGQLDENGCQILIENDVLCLRDQQQRLLVRVERARNRLYVVTLDVTQPVCLSAHAGEVARTLRAPQLRRAPQTHTPRHGARAADDRACSAALRELPGREAKAGTVPASGQGPRRRPPGPHAR